MNNHDYINIGLIILLSIITIQYVDKIKCPVRENMDMSMFGEENNIKQKKKLENLEKYLLKNNMRYRNGNRNKYRYLKNRDKNVVYDPLYPPEKRIERSQYIFPPYGNNYNNEYEDNESIPQYIFPPYGNNYNNESIPQFYVRTRGEPDNYQLIGLLYNDSVDKYYQLYGRRTYLGSPEWEHYIRGKDEGGLDIKFPISNNKQEIMNGTSMKIPLDDLTYQVKIYDFDQPRYDPLYPPEKRIEQSQYIFPPYGNNYNNESIPQFYVRTREEPDNYQLIGLLYNDSVDKYYQLYGRRTYPGSPEWEHYIRGKDKGGLDFKFPISNNKQEIMDGTSMKIPLDDLTYQVKIYDLTYQVL